MLSTGDVPAEGARRFRDCYEGTLAGKRFKGDGGQYILGSDPIR